MERIAAFKELVLKSVAGKESWARKNALRELYILSKRKPGLFTREELGKLRALRRGEGKGEFQRYLLSIITHIEVLPPLQRAVHPKKPGDTVEGVRTLRTLLLARDIGSKQRSFREEAVFDCFRAEKDFETRVRIVKIIGYLGVPRHANGLIRALATDRSPSVRVAAAQALANFPGRTTLKYLRRALGDDVLRVQMAAVVSLGKIGDATVRADLQGIVRDEGRPEALRALARKALGNLPEKE
jgi:hypothetical protein